jgi:hypothetical protein
MSPASCSLRRFGIVAFSMVVLNACGNDSAEQTSLNSTNGSGLTAPSENTPNAIKVDAGADRVADEATQVRLTVSIEKDPQRSIRSIQWSQSEQDVLKAQLPADTGSDEILVTLPQTDRDVDLNFAVVVTDDLGRTFRDEVRITVRDTIANKLPKAVIAAAGRVDSNTRTVALDGCASSDEDGTVSGFQWARTFRDQTVTLPQTTCKISAALEPADAVEQQYRFALTVTDNRGAKSEPAFHVLKQDAKPVNSPARMQDVSVNPNPAYFNETVTLQARSVDAENNPVTYRWLQTAGDPVTFSDTGTDTIQWVAPAKAQTITFVVSVMDGLTAADKADSKRVDVPVSQRPTYSPVTAQQCLANPALEGCGNTFKRLIPSNPVTPAIGISQATDSAGVCTPEGNTGWPHFYGTLHEHTAYSDGTALTKPADVYARAKLKGFDFAFSTDHSDNMGLPVPVTLADDPEFCAGNPLACVLSDPSNPASNFMKWSATQTQADAATNASFSAIRGFEWTSDRFGHANILFSRNFINPKTGPGYAASMDGLWSWFLTSPDLGGGQDGVLVFNHPGREDALHSPFMSTPLGGDPAYTFNDFEYVAAADYRVAGVEVFGKSDEYDTKGKKGSWLAYALDKGWYLGAAGSEDHHGTSWGEADLPKTVLIARTRKREDLREAMLARRFYAVAQNFNNLRLEVNAVDADQTYQMGSRIASARTSLQIEMNVSARQGKPLPLDLKDVQFEVLSSQADNSVSYKTHKTLQGPVASFSIPVRGRQDWLFVRVRDLKSKRIVAVSSPIWIRPGSAALPSCNPSR